MVVRESVSVFFKGMGGGGWEVVYRSVERDEYVTELYKVTRRRTEE